MKLTKQLLLATVAVSCVSLPALAQDAPASGVGATTGASVIPAAPSNTTNTGAGGLSHTLPAEDLNAAKAPDEEAAPLPSETSTAAPAEAGVAPTIAPAPATFGAAPAVAPITAAPDDTTSSVPQPDAMAPAPLEPAPTEAAAPVTTPAEPVAAPVAETPAPAVAKPAKPKVSPPAKLSALAKKYKLMSLDADGNKSLSKSEFTADGFANAKTFNRFDADGNGKLTNSEINAYASVIEANSNK